MVSLDRKYIPIQNLKKYDANFTSKEKIDPMTGQVVKKARKLQFSYVLIQDSFSNVYMIPCNQNGMQYYSFTDIVEAADGNQEKIDKIENSRLEIRRIYGADLCGESWQHKMYCGKMDGGLSTIKLDFEDDCNLDKDNRQILPDEISSFKILAQNKAQVSALIKSAVPLNRKK
ncbi:MAG TPA: hypothetical protein DEQ88_00325 [Clostridiales bacterium]|nr:hypothetical protein [Clostridiales bacterium]